MSEKPKNTTAQNTIEDPKKSSDWLGGPQNGNETPTESDYTKHRFNETPGESDYTKHRFSETSTKEDKNPKEGSDFIGGPQDVNATPGKPPEGAYQQNGQSWLGGPQNGDDTPGSGNGGNASGGGNGGNG
jgi:hypothetical protein